MLRVPGRLMVTQAISRGKVAATCRPNPTRGHDVPMAHERAGQPALPEDLINVDDVLSAYHGITPDPSNPDQQVVFGTSGHRDRKSNV